VSERETDFERESGGGRESKCVCVSVCVGTSVFSVSLTFFRKYAQIPIASALTYTV